MADKVSNSQFWATPAGDLVKQAGTSADGLTSAEAAGRLQRYGPNTLRARKRTDSVTLLLGQFKSPIILILIFAAVLSVVLRDHVDAGIILGIVLVSGLLGFWQERGANDAVEKLLAIVQVKADGAAGRREGRRYPCRGGRPGRRRASQRRGRRPRRLPPARVERSCLPTRPRSRGRPSRWKSSRGRCRPTPPSPSAANSLFMGTHVVSGSATAVVVHTAKDTEFGQVSERLRLRAAETEFEHGVRHFGYFLCEVTLVLVIVIFAINVYLHRPVLDSLPVLSGARGGAHPAAPAGHHQHQPGARGQAHGRGEGHRQAPGRHRESGQHERALLRQDRDPHRGRGAPPRRSRRGRRPTATGSCSSPTSTPSSRPASRTRSTSPSRATRSWTFPDTGSWTRSPTTSCANA